LVTENGEAERANGEAVKRKRYGEIFSYTARARTRNGIGGIFATARKRNGIGEKGLLPLERRNGAVSLSVRIFATA
jgi:hypothetical protein